LGAVRTSRALWVYWRHKSYWDIEGLRVLQRASGSPGTQGPSMEVRAIEGYLAPFSAVETVKMFETIGGPSWYVVALSVDMFMGELVLALVQLTEELMAGLIKL
jgi:hypothetical protein